MNMLIWLLGAEQETNRRLAIDGKATHLGMAFPSLQRRLPKKKPYLISERFPAEVDVMLAGGAKSLAKLGADAFVAYQAALASFVGLNVDSLAMVTEVDDPRLDPQHRAEMVAALGDRYVPVWQEDQGLPALEALSEGHRTVGVRAQAITSSPMLLSRLNPLHARHGTRWHILDGARPDDLMSGRFHSAATLAWLSPMRNGETIIFDGHRMQRYPARMKDVARNQHRTKFRDSGYDADAILNGDHEELTRYTASAFVALEKHLSKRKTPDNPFTVVSEWNEAGEEVETPSSDVDNLPAVVRNENRAPKPRAAAKQMLPIFGAEVATESEFLPDGTSQEVKRLLARKGTATLRACDSCHIAATCPAFSPGSECAYELPLEIRTKEQLSSALASILEIQFDRVAFMAMAEQVSGGYADPNTSAEIDRLANLVKTIKDIEDNREFIKIGIEAKAGAGVMSTLFGSQARKLADLDNPVDTRALEEIIDADLT